MMRSLFSGVAGLKGHQTRMDVIGNNIANVNATGFKSSRVTFADTLSQTQSGAAAPGDTIGGTNPKQIGLGTGVASIDLLFTDGSVQSTGKNTDLCLSGNGLFVVKSGNDVYYTRDGAFEFDAEGNYVLPGNGMKVQGWMAQDGVLSTNGETTGIQVQAGKSMAAKATETVTYTNNLNSAVPTILEISGGEDVTTKTKTYTTAEEGSLTGTEDFPVTLTLVDGKTVSVKDGTYKVGDTYIEKITTGSAAASDTVTVRLNLADGTVVVGQKGTTYTVGNDYEYTTTNTGDSITATTDRRVIVTTKGGKVTDELTSGTYKVGDKYKWTLKSGESVTASDETIVNVTLENGASIKGTAGNSYTVGNAYSYQADSVEVKKDDTKQTVTLNFEDGSTKVIDASALSANTTYAKGDIYSDAGTDKTIKNVTIESKAESVTAESEIMKLQSKTNIVSLETEKIIEKIEQEYIVQAKATSAKPITLKMSDGTTVTQTSGSYKVDNSLPITTTISAYDTLGNVHSIPIYFTLTKTYSGSETTVPGNTWTVSVNSDGSGTSTLVDGTIITMEDTELKFTTAGKYYSGSPSTSVLTLKNGSLASQNMTIDLSALTQFAGNSTVNGTADGNAAGTLKSVSIDNSGVITGVYTNGVKQKEAQIAIAQFTNASGLEKTGSSLYQESNNSGKANVKTAIDLGCTITPSALEMSNVDIANEFSDMIITQRGFQSNSKVITVGDEMLETLINMKR